MTRSHAEPRDWNAVLTATRRDLETGETIEALIRLVDAVRPHPDRPEDAERRLAALCDALSSAPPAHAAALGAAIRQLLSATRCTETLVERGVPGDRGFVDELTLRIGRRVLPDVVDDARLSGLVRRVFSSGRDHHWLHAIESETWRRLLVLIGITAETVEGIADELATALRVLAHQIASVGLSPDITRLMPEVDEPDSPFLCLSDAVLRYVLSFENTVVGDEVPLLEDTLGILDRCRQLVERLRAEKHRFGTSLRLTNLTRRLDALIERIDLLLHLTEPIELDFPRCARRLTIALVEAEDTRDHIGPHLGASADLLAFQVVEHAARVGSKYITKTAAEYRKFLISSLIGGAVVAVFGLLKVALSGDMSPAASALVFGLNYAVCFVMIALVGGTLATKQPAMTANTLARTMEPGPGQHDVEGLADLVVRVSRSQFISFVGNLAAAMPLGMAISWAFSSGLGVEIASPEKAEYLLASLHPWHGPSLLYAGLAGVFLSTAGLVSGWLDNRNLYRRLPQRVANHPGLCRVLGDARARRLGDFVAANLGKLGGNIYLGFCLGAAGSVGVILGLPLDIRHIAFASAHYGLALETLGTVPVAIIWQVGLGVALIGLVNFLVSFGLTLTLALRARRFTFGEEWALVGAVARRFLRRPWLFFLPTRSDPPRPATEP